VTGGASGLGLAFAEAPTTAAEAAGTHALTGGPPRNPHRAAMRIYLPNLAVTCRYHSRGSL
jgi:hypothetical protein